MSPLKLSIGAAGFPRPTLQLALDTLKAVGIHELDTAELYGNSEADLGAVNAAEQGFLISTKNPGGWSKGALQEVIPKTTASLSRLNTQAVDILYIHGPDRSVTLDEWVPHMDSLYREGKFQRFGVSNFSPEEVRTLHAYCKEKGFVLPTVYQGNYNALSRLIDTTLFPVLRELNIAFYAYSPVAGGFLTKSRRALEEGAGTGRFAADMKSGLKMYQTFYLKPSMIKALDKWEELAEVQGVSKAELAYRWLYYHSEMRPELGDTVIVGASKVEQITQTVEGLERGPLKAEVVRGIDEFWELVKEDAIIDNFEATGGVAG
ncbi:Aflatoxin B1 aldehyde reductase member 4 [Cytospora mali]|uniref:Aflatoxin B1 aldehyde reductase member 4 n=1 Tax=Cytospora mali TaxID=578113 RepID=A0A194W421_CYTMA|nr:Aflatoxin B1 aldehyde reductase member 4 [Valsa mali]